MSWLFDDPTVLYIIGFVVFASLTIALVKSGRPKLLIPMAATGGLMLLVWGADWLVTTDREEVVQRMFQLATAVEIQDRTTIMAAIEPSKTRLRNEAAGALDRAKASNVRITHLDIEVRDAATFPTARVDLYAKANFKVAGAGNFDDYVVHVLIFLEKQEDGTWIITNYEHKPILGEDL